MHSNSTIFTQSDMIFFLIPGIRFIGFVRTSGISVISIEQKGLVYFLGAHAPINNLKPRRFKGVSFVTNGSQLRNISFISLKSRISQNFLIFHKLLYSIIFLRIMNSCNKNYEIRRCYEDKKIITNLDDYNLNNSFPLRWIIHFVTLLTIKRPPYTIIRQTKKRKEKSSYFCLFVYIRRYSTRNTARTHCPIHIYIALYMLRLNRFFVCVEQWCCGWMENKNKTIGHTGTFNHDSTGEQTPPQKKYNNKIVIEINQLCQNCLLKLVDGEYMYKKNIGEMKNNKNHHQPVTKMKKKLKIDEQTEKHTKPFSNHTHAHTTLQSEGWYKNNTKIKWFFFFLLSIIIECIRHEFIYSRVQRT